MGILTTTIGAYPKPNKLEAEDLFRGGYKLGESKNIYTNFVIATRDAVRDQIEAGIDIPTDGEQWREHYIFYHCRHLNGINFDHMQTKVLRGVEVNTKEVPTINGKITAKEKHFLPQDYRIATSFANGRAVKITAPGPMTITDTVVDEYYGDKKKLGVDLANAINIELKALQMRDVIGFKWMNHYLRGLLMMHWSMVLKI